MCFLYFILCTCMQRVWKRTIQLEICCIYGCMSTGLLFISFVTDKTQNCSLNSFAKASLHSLVMPKLSLCIIFIVTTLHTLLLYSVVFILACRLTGPTYIILFNDKSPAPHQCRYLICGYVYWNSRKCFVSKVSAGRGAIEAWLLISWSAVLGLYVKVLRCSWRLKSRMISAPAGWEP